MPEGEKAATGAAGERAFWLETGALQMAHGYRLAYYGAYFSVGASFEVFSLTLVLTGVLLDRPLPAFWWALVGLYLLTGFAFVAFGVYGFSRTKRLQEVEWKRLADKYT